MFINRALSPFVFFLNPSAIFAGMEIAALLSCKIGLSNFSPLKTNHYPQDSNFTEDRIPLQKI